MLFTRVQGVGRKSGQLVAGFLSWLSQVRTNAPDHFDLRQLGIPKVIQCPNGHWANSTRTWEPPFVLEGSQRKT